MSGLIGLIGFSPEHLKRVAATCMQRLVRFPWDHWDWWESDDHTIGLGRVDIGILNPEQQPVMSEDRTVIALISGELRRTESLRRELEREGHCFCRGDDAELVLFAYQSRGPDFVALLEGSFHLAVLDCRAQRLLLANDRFGRRPLYWAKYKRRFVFGPEMKTILADPDFERRLPDVSLAEYVRFQHLLGDKTFFEGISLLRNASCLTYDLANGVVEIKPYWDYFRDVQPRPDVSFAEAVEEGVELVQAAVDRCTQGDHRVGVYLSGGLDSRLISGCLAKRISGFPTISYGDPECADVVIARRIARVLGTEHHFFDLNDGRWVAEYAKLHLDLTEGNHSWIHCHGVSTLAAARELIDVNLPGLNVDTLIGPSIWDPATANATDELAFVCALYRVCTTTATWPGLSEAEAYCLFTPSYRERTKWLALESLASELAVSRCQPYERRLEHYKLFHRTRRFAQYYAVLFDSHFENRCVGFDYKLYDYMAALPHRLKAGRRLQQAIVERVNRRLAEIPQAKDWLLFTSRPVPRITHHVITRLKQRYNRHIHPLFWQPRPLYADYEQWLRGSLRLWAESILFDGRLASRGIFDPAAVRSLFDRQQSGAETNLIGKIAPIMTLEMLFRAFYDTSTICA